MITRYIRTDETATYEAWGWRVVPLAAHHGAGGYALAVLDDESPHAAIQARTALERGRNSGMMPGVKAPEGRAGHTTPGLAAAAPATEVSAMADRGHNSAFARAPEDPVSHLDAAIRVLLATIRGETTLDDEALDLLMLAEPDEAARKRLSCGLHGLKLITCEQHVHALIRFVFGAGERV